MKIRIATLGLLTFLHFSLKSISQPSDEFKYLMVLNHLHTDSTTIERIKGLYSRVKLVNKKVNHVEFNVLDKVMFFNLSVFTSREILTSSELGIEQMLIDSSKIYHERFFFTAFESPFLKKIARPNDSRLYLTFSKPVGNYIIVELNNINNRPNAIRRFGLAMSILFIFDSNGFITRTLIQSAIYN